MNSIGSPSNAAFAVLNYLFFQTVLEFACSKAGFVLYNLDPALAITDRDGAKASLKKALEVTEANILVTQEAGSDVNYVKIVKEVIPETRLWDFGEGLPFFSPHFPHLRYPCHTGFDHQNKEGMIPFRHLIVPSGLLEEQLAGWKASGDTPLFGELKMGPDGPTKGKILSNDDVAKHNVWPLYNSILKKEYLEVPGIGNVW